VKGWLPLAYTDVSTTGLNSLLKFWQHLYIYNETDLEQINAPCRLGYVRIDGPMYGQAGRSDTSVSLLGRRHGYVARNLLAIKRYHRAPANQRTNQLTNQTSQLTIPSISY
jgi:hypothetical protein